MTVILQDAACEVLCAPNPQDKVRLAHALKTSWESGACKISAKYTPDMPQTPGRPPTPELVSPKLMKRRRLGSVAGRIALLHAIAHIEFNAINLAADLLARFGADTRIDETQRSIFIRDWIGVLDDEAKHFTMINTRLGELGSSYGALDAHNGLWEAAQATRHDLAARLAIAPMVLEARGLDVTPGMIVKLQNVDDNESARLLGIIYEEEIPHVAAGSRWFTHICTRENRTPGTYFQALVAQHYKGQLKPPFNTGARDQAGLPLHYYQL
jgi:uncharacterized ferritin-like protein (DUF455 family)